MGHGCAVIYPRKGMGRGLLQVPVGSCCIRKLDVHGYVHPWALVGATVGLGLLKDIIVSCVDSVEPFP